jgi:hypothetical protein
MNFFRKLATGFNNLMGRFTVPADRVKMDDGRIYPRGYHIAPSPTNPHSQNSDQNLRVHCRDRSSPSARRERHGKVIPNSGKR